MRLLYTHARMGFRGIHQWAGGLVGTHFRPNGDARDRFFWTRCFRSGCSEATELIVQTNYTTPYSVKGFRKKEAHKGFTEEKNFSM